MKDMKFKVICLILVIPLLLIFATGTIVKVSDIYVDIPVSEVKISGSGIEIQQGAKFVNKDLANADGGNRYELYTDVYPENATHKTVSYELIEGDDKGIELSGGSVVSKKPGKYKIKAMSGQCSDTVTLNFYSTKPLSLEYAEDANKDIYVKRGIAISLQNNVKSDVDNAGIYWETKNGKGNVEIIGNKLVGVVASDEPTVINATVDGLTYDEDKKVFIEKEISLPFNVYVADLKGSEAVVYGYAEDETAVKKVKQTAVFEILYGENVDVSAWQAISPSDELLECSTQNVEVERKFLVSATWKNPDKDVIGVDPYVITIRDGVKDIFHLNVQYSDSRIIINMPDTIDIDKALSIEAELDGISIYDDKVIGEYAVDVEVSPSGAELKLGGNGKYRIVTKDEKTYTLTVRLSPLNGSEEYEATKAIQSVDPITSITLTLPLPENGLKDETAIAGYKFDSAGELKPNSVKFVAVAKTLLGKTLSEFDAVWSCDDTLLELADDGTAQVIGDGVVNVTVKSEKYPSSQSSVQALCVSKGIAVNNYTELMRVNHNRSYSGGKLGVSDGGYAADGYCTVLTKDVMLAPSLKDSDNVKDFTLQIKPTADIKYYENNNAGDAQSLRLNYAMEIAASVYGNGHFICADYITRNGGLKSNPVFNGPIDLVRYLYQKNASTDESNVYIKSQDNMCFVVKKDGITLDNVELKGCSDKSLTDEGATEANLGNLDNTGTVLEVIGNDFVISYSKINNGRTVMRIYGESADTAKRNGEGRTAEGYGKTNVTIKNCILSYGREFLLKVGTNRIKRVPFTEYNSGVKYLNTMQPTPLPSVESAKKYYDDAAPYFTDKNGNNYQVGNEAKDYDDYFYENYVLTDVNVQDTAFAKSGLFCIGMDAMFGGLCLHGWDYGRGNDALTYEFGTKLGWGGISGTSYPAKVNLIGDVRFYDWKDVTKVDSSTLVTGSQTMISLIGLDLNVSKLLTRFSSVDSSAAELLTDYNGVKWVNGAIAFYGGGKNYSIVDDSGLNGISSVTSLKRYQVGVEHFVDESRTRFVYYTAGPNPFRFMMYPASTGLDKLTPELQANHFAANTAYSYLHRKK